MQNRAQASCPWHYCYWTRYMGVAWGICYMGVHLVYGLCIVRGGWAPTGCTRIEMWQPLPNTLCWHSMLYSTWINRKQIKQIMQNMIKGHIWSVQTRIYKMHIEHLCVLGIVAGRQHGSPDPNRDTGREDIPPHGEPGLRLLTLLSSAASSSSTLSSSSLWSLGSIAL